MGSLQIVIVTLVTMSFVLMVAVFVTSAKRETAQETDQSDMDMPPLDYSQHTPEGETIVNRGAW